MDTIGQAVLMVCRLLFETLVEVVFTRTGRQIGRALGLRPVSGGERDFWLGVLAFVVTLTALQLVARLR